MVLRIQRYSRYLRLPISGKVDWAQRELGSVNPILWDIIFSEQVNKDLLYEEIKSILDNQLTLTLIQKKF